MRKYSDDAEGGGRSFYCKCGKRITYLSQINGISDDWPRDVFEDAVRGKLIDRRGRLLS
jgi:hypothetical protein